MAKVYAVRKGRETGVFYTWADCQKSILKFPGAEYKSFPTEEEAEAYLNPQKPDTKIDEDVFAFVDGSFNQATGVYGYGGFLSVHGKKYILQGNDKDKEAASSRNVAGEVCGSMAAIKKAIELGLKTLTIYYDYTGIEYWATGEWKRNKALTRDYYEYIQSVKDKITLNFVHVKGHSGIEGNELADQLAKESVGIQ